MAELPQATSEFRRNLLFFSLENWDLVWRRNQFICRELMSRFPNLKILWVEPPYDLSHDPMHFDSKSLRLSPSDHFPNMSVFKPLKLLPNVVGRRLNSTIMRAQVTNALRSLGWKEFDVWVNDQKARHYLPDSGMNRLVYDVTDDWTQFDQPARVKKAVIEDDAWMLDNADETIVCSEWLYKKNAFLEQHVHLIPNGVDAQRYSPDALEPLTVPDQLRSSDCRTVGYVGTLHAERLNLDLISMVSDLMPEVSFVFIGPNCLSEQETEKLRAHPNIKLLGAVDYSILPSYIKGLDVCMTPHKVTNFTESLDPLKLYEYMSTGKPVVSTPCSGFRDLPELVYLGTDAESFVNAVKQALGERDLLTARRLEWARNQTWEHRVENISRILGWSDPLVSACSK